MNRAGLYTSGYRLQATGFGCSLPALPLERGIFTSGLRPEPYAGRSRGP